MTTEATPAASPDSAPATEQAPAPTQAESSTRAARRARAVAAIESTPTPSVSAKTEPSPASDAEASADEAPKPSREEQIAARLKAQREKREAEAEAKRRSEVERAIVSRAQRDDAQVETRARTEIVEKFKRDPIATAREMGMEPRQLLELLTKDALSPGAVRALSEAESGKSEAEKVRQEMAEFKRQLEERDAVAAAEQRRSAFVTSTADAAKWPLLSKLDPQDRLDEGIDAWTRLQQEGHEYDPDLVADLAEARLEKRAKKLLPAAAETPQPQAAVKPRTTITPAMASDRGAPASLSRAERKARLVSELERADAARRAGNTTSQ